MDPFSWIIWTLISLALSYAIARLTAKKPSNQYSKPNTFDTPTVEEGGKYTIVFGTCYIENPVLDWWGDTRADAIRIRAEGGSYYTGGFKYYIGSHFRISQGESDGIIQMKVNDAVIWPDPDDKTSLNADGATTADINAPNAFGGDVQPGDTVNQGGVVGTVDIQYGEPTQVLNDYLAEQMGSYISANRGFTGATLRQVYIGTQPMVGGWKFLVKRVLKLTDGSEQWYVAKAAIRTYELNPAHILRECYTNTEWGLGMSTACFNDTVWEAVADALYDEGFGLCIKWEDPNQTLEDFIKDILRYIDAVIYQDHLTGEIVLKLIRDDYDIEDLDEYDNSDIEELDEFARGTFHKVPDVTYLQYWNMIDNMPISIACHDLGMIMIQNNQIVTNEVNFYGIIDNELAGKVAMRVQQQLALFPAAMKIRAKRTMAGIKPGDVFKLSWPTLGITQLVVRVMGVHYGTLEDGGVSFECVEDIFGMKDALYAPPPSTNWFNPFTEYTSLLGTVNVATTVTGSLSLLTTGLNGSIGINVSITGDLTVTPA